MVEDWLSLNKKAMETVSSAQQLNGAVYELETKLNASLVSEIQINATEIHDALRYIPLDERSDFINRHLDVLRRVLPKTITTPADIQTILNYCPLEQQPFMLKAIENVLPKIIQLPSHVRELLQKCESKQYALLIAAINEILPLVIKSVEDTLPIMKDCSRETKPILIKALSSIWPEIITSPLAVWEVMKVCNREQREIFLATIQENLGYIIQSSEDIENLLLYCSGMERVSDFFVSIKDDVPDMIVDEESVLNVLNNCSQEEAMGFLDIIKNKLPELITSVSIAETIMTYCSNKIKKALFINAIQSFLPSLIKSNDELQMILKHCTPAQKIIFQPSIPPVHKEKMKLIKVALNELKRSENETDMNLGLVESKKTQ